jgi:hypothetical protein
VSAAFAESHAGRLWVRRDSAYVTWRYSDHPLRRYATLELRDGRDLHGAAVIRLFRGVDSDEAELIDFWWKDNRAGSIQSCLGAVAQWCSTRGMRRLALWTPTNTLLDSILTKVGMSVVRQERPLIAKDLESRSARSNRPWIVMMGDAETY